MSPDLHQPDFSTLGDDAPEPAEVVATVHARLAARRRRHRRLGVVGTAAAVVIVAAGVATVGAVLPSDSVQPAGPGAEYRPEVDSTAYRCYVTADLSVTEPPFNYFSASIGSRDEHAIIKAAPYALDGCRESWEGGGSIREAAKVLEEQHGVTMPTHGAPDLVACVLPPELSDDGRPEVAVFPGAGDSTCTALNLTAY